MARQYFCWRVCLTFGCGCVEYTPTQHVCGVSRDGCSAWYVPLIKFSCKLLQ